MVDKIIRIGTRSSELALWQANLVQKQLEAIQVKSEIVKIDSTGDFILNKPLYELGVVGVFTRNLDAALLNGTIDIAVHSLKDVPTVLPQGIVQAAVLKRANHNDILVFKDNCEFLSLENATIATGSLRRKAQWLNKFPSHTIVDLRGNVNTRLKKLEDNNWNGAIFAAAGLSRIKKLPENHVKLSWMLPAPAQGVIMIATLAENTFALEACHQLNDKETEICAGIERAFLNTLEGGCTAPIGALALIKEDENKVQEINFKGVLFSLDGKKKVEVNRLSKLDECQDLGKWCANEVLKNGGRRLLLDEGLKESFDYHIYSTKELSKPQQDLFLPNIKVTYSDFIRVKHNRLKPEIAKKTFQHVVFTSQNAVEAVLQNFAAADLNFTKIYCVGRRTKKLIEDRIGTVFHIEQSALKLAEYLLTQVKNEETVTFFCGDLRRDELPEILEKNNIELNEIEVYSTQDSATTLTETYDGLLFFSPSAIHNYLAANKASDILVFCIGETTAAEAKNHFKDVKSAKLPTVNHVIDLVNETFK